MRLLAGMKDKTLSKEIQLCEQMAIDAIKSEMRVKEMIQIKPGKNMVEKN